MKIRFISKGLVFVLFLSAVVLASAAKAENVVANPGFEEPDYGKTSLPLNWRAIFSAEGEGEGVATTGEIRIETENPHSGTNCMYLRSDGPRYARLQMEVNLIPGAKYRFSGFVRTMNKEANISINLQQGKEEDRWMNNMKLEESSATGEWTRLETEFTFPETAGEKALLMLRVLPIRGGSCEAWFDDVTLEKIE